MAQAKTLFNCEICGYQTSQWMGKCPNCKEWNSLTQTVLQKTTKQQTIAKLLSEVEMTELEYTSTGVKEIDQVLGGGFVRPSINLLSGEPGIGKSTLTLLACLGVIRSHTDKKILYISGEESVEQIAHRMKKVGIYGKNIFLLSETDWQTVEYEIQHLSPDFIIIDSIQTISCSDISSYAGSPNQIKEITQKLVILSKKMNLIILVIGHVTKDGRLAGPRHLEHMVDSVFMFERDNSDLRVLKSIKNRFGNTNQKSYFEMTDKGLIACRS